MKKILKINIKNFQSHKDSVISFDNFTVINGPTDNGKSAIIRAIKWCLYNSPDGTNFIRHGENTADVTVYFSDGTSVKRVKGKKENYYILAHPDGKELQLENFDRGPVSEVVNFHKMYEVDLFGKRQALNICDQLSAPFFLSNSPIERAQMVGQIGNTEVIDFAITDTLSEIRDKKSLLKVYHRDLLEVDSELQNYTDLHLMEEDLNKTKLIKEDTLKLVFELNKLIKNKNSLFTLYENKKKYEEILKSESDINSGLETINDILNEYHEYQKVLRNNSILKCNIERKENLEEVVSIASHKEIEDFINGLSVIDEKIKYSKSLKVLKLNIENQEKTISKTKAIIEGEDDIKNTIDKLDICKEKISCLINLSYKGELFKKAIDRKLKGRKVIEDLDVQYNDALEEYKEKLLQNPHCPLCMSKINKEKINNIKIV